MENAVITIVTTFYNPDLRRLVRTINSVINQCCDAFIFYLYDDGSTSHDWLATLDDLLREAKKRGIRFKFESGGVNLGVDSAHFHCFSQCQTPFFMWLDVGDYISKRFVFYAKREMMLHPKCDIFHFNGSRFTEQKEGEKLVFDPVSQYHKYKKRVLRASDQLPYILTGYNFYWFHFCVSRKAFLASGLKAFQNGKQNGGRWYDYQLLLAIYSKGFRQHYLKKPVSYILTDPFSVSSMPTANPAMDDPHIVFQFLFPDRPDLIDSYSAYIDLMNLRRQIRQNMLSGNLQKAKEQHRFISRRLKELGFPKHYYLDRRSCMAYLVLLRFTFLKRLYEKRF